MKAFWLSAFLALPAWAALPLQPLIDATPAGGTLRPAAGLYAGPVVIERPMVIDGGGKVSVDAGDYLVVGRSLPAGKGQLVALNCR